MVEGAALEMLCTEMYLGFESLTLRQIRTLIVIQLGFFLFAPHPFSRSLIYEALRLLAHEYNEKNNPQQSNSAGDFVLL